MAGRRLLRLLVGGGVLLVVALFAVADLLLLAAADGPAARAQTHRAVAAAAALALLVCAALVAAVRRLVLGPLQELGREIRILGVHPEHAIELPRRHLLGDIPEAIHRLGAGLAGTQRQIDGAVAASSADLGSRQARLEAVLTSLEEGIVVCDERSRVVFYNPAARRVFGDDPALGVGRSLHLLIAAAPVENSLQVLRRQRARNPEADGGGDVSFVGTSLQGVVLSCRVRLLPAAAGVSWSYLLTLRDVGAEADAQGRRESLLRETIKQMRVSLTGLGVSAESLEMIPELDRESRAALEGAIRREARGLVGQFEVLARGVEGLGSPRYLIRDVFAEDVVAAVAQRVEAGGLRLTMIGDPLWVRADVHALLFLLEFFAGGIRRACGVDAVEVETLLGDRRVYFTYVWHGAPVPQREIQRWMSSAAEPYDAHTVAEVLERLGSEVWSRPHATAGYATLTFPLPAASSRWGAPAARLPERPVYAGADADAWRHEDAGDREGLPLERLTFVVFDTETTGLAPDGGDRVVSLAAVKIVGRGIVVGETFDRLVDPQRDIPASSTRFHGITDEMVRGRPAIAETLRAFHAFVGDAVLVGHNAAFDMRFIRGAEEQAGVRFHGPLLDTLGLSRFLHDHTPAHSLDAVARRLGVAVRDRHTAMGDALITAQVFLKLLYLLQERRVTTLGAALEASGR